LSRDDAWAVGATTDSEGYEQTLIEHWNGAVWRQLRSPSPGGPLRSNVLFGVAALSRSDAWAVGTAVVGRTDDTLVEHWNGSTWSRVKSPEGPSGTAGSFLYAVVALSPSSAWAVGTYARNGADQTLIERWNGARWKRVSSPAPGGPSHSSFLSAVAVRSASSAWAAGFFDTATHPGRTLTLYWNGRTWTRITSPSH